MYELYTTDVCDTEYAANHLNSENFIGIYNSKSALEKGIDKYLDDINFEKDYGRFLHNTKLDIVVLDFGSWSKFLVITNGNLYMEEMKRRA